MSYSNHPWVTDLYYKLVVGDMALEFARRLPGKLSREECQEFLANSGRAFVYVRHSHEAILDRDLAQLFGLTSHNGEI